MEKKLVITIEREYGSGGRVLGQQLSELLGIEYYDDDIIKTASETSAVGEQYFLLREPDRQIGQETGTKLNLRHGAVHAVHDEGVALTVEGTVRRQKRQADAIRAVSCPKQDKTVPRFVHREEFFHRRFLHGMDETC